MPDTESKRCIWTFSWSIYCSLKPHQKWSPWKGGCHEAILKEEKQGEKAELCQMTQEVDWKSGNRSVVMNPAQSPDLNITEAMWDHLDKEELWNVVHEAWTTFPADYLKKWHESLSNRVQAVLKNKGAHIKYWLSSLLELYKLCICPIYCISIYFSHVNLQTTAPIFPLYVKKSGVT